MKLFHLVLILVTFSLVQSQLKKPIVKQCLLKSAEVGEPLILTPYLEQNKAEQAKSLAQVHYAGFQDVVSYSGYFTVNKPFNSNLFFWFFPSENNYLEDPVVLWLQGGPGSPSLYALFTENGPFIVNANRTVSLREYSWTKNHSVIYIDSPAGTGFSFTNNGFAQNQTQVGEDLYEALQQFFTLFPELQKNQFYITGESYAGKYIPALGHALQIHNPIAKKIINLQGLMIGNGWTDPINQLVYGEFLYQIGLVDLRTRDKLNSIAEEVKQLIKNENFEAATNRWNGDMLALVSEVSEVASIYNYLLQKDEDLDSWQVLVEHPEVRKAIHVGNITVGDENVWNNLHEDMTKTVAPWVIELLKQYRMLVFNGQLDIIVAYPLTVNYIQNLNFSAAEEYKTAVRKIWQVDSEVAGYFKTAGKLTEGLVRNAGHMVPKNQPKWASNLIYQFTRNTLNN